jgi:uncharacterized protein
MAVAGAQVRHYLLIHQAAPSRIPKGPPMLHRLALSFGLIAACSTAQAACTGTGLMDRLTDAERAQLTATAAATPFGDGLIWTATRGPTTLTIVGTMHLYDTRHDAVFDILDPVVAGMDLLLVEATAEEEAALQDAMISQPGLMFITDGPTLPEMLDDETWAALSTAMRERGMAPFIGSRFQPWFLMLSLGMPPCAMDDLLAGRRGLDQMLIDSAAEFGVQTIALEPWDTLFTLMADTPMDEQLELLKMSLMDADLQREVYVTMLDGYFAGKIAEVWEVGRVAMAYVPGLDPVEADAMFRMSEDMLLTARNQSWIPVIEAAATQHDQIMVAAGAAHLPGEFGVLNLLQANGWVIVAVE